MPDLPFGFSAGDAPDPDRPDKDPNPNSPQNPFGFGGAGGAGFDMSDLGQIFTKLGEMFSGAGGRSPLPPARQMRTRSLGFVTPVPEKTISAIADAVRLAETWLDGVTPL